MSKLQHLQNIDFDDISKGKKSGVEENVKQLIVVPLLQFLGFTDEKDVDYEYKTKSGGRADIALKVDRKPKVFVEVKSLEKHLLDYVEQALSYAHDEQVGFVLLTNGKEFRLFKSFIENVVDPRDRELLRVELRRLGEQIGELQKWISKDSLISHEIDKIAEREEKQIRERVTAPALIKHLKESKDLLAQEAKERIVALYPDHEGFSRAVIKWADASRLDLDKDVWKDKLAQEVAYSFINRLYFYKIAEDRNIVKPKLTKTRIKHLEESIDLSDIIVVAFEEILRIDYRAIFEDETGILGRYIRFDNEKLRKVVYPLLEYNFAAIDQDILGRVYQEHISRDERKKLGQFYTPEWIIDFIVGRVQINAESKILDPACGSGGFLIKCYQVLRNEYQRRGFSNDSIHSLILDNNIFGFDINPFAVQLSAMNLALREIDRKTNNINVIETDSLASHLEEYLERKLGTVDKNGKTGTRSEFPKSFNIIVGNPPYFDVKLDEIKTRYPNQSYSTILRGKTNIASLFLFRCAELLEDGGYLGFVFPKSVLYVEPWKPVRKFILDNFNVEEIYDLREAFEDVLLEQIILILKKTNTVKTDSKVNIVFRSWKKGGDYEDGRHTILNTDLTEDLFPIYLNDFNKSIKSKMIKNSLLLGDVARLTRGIYVNRSANILKDEHTSLSDIRTYSGKDLMRYGIRGHKYLDRNSNQISNADRKKIDELMCEKLMFQGIIGCGRNYIKLAGTYDDDKSLNLDTVVNVLIENKSFDQLYVLGIVNSRLASYYLNNMVFCHSERTMHFEYAKHIPIKQFEMSEQKKIGGLILQLFHVNEEIVKIQKQSDSMPQFEPEFIEMKSKELSLKEEAKRLDRDIDQMVFSIYGLNNKEIQAVLDEESWAVFKVY